MEAFSDRPAIARPGERTAEEWLRMGERCLDGKGDYEQAAFCFRQASLLGSDAATVRLDALAVEGKGVIMAAHPAGDRTTGALDGSSKSPAVCLRTRETLVSDPNRCPSCGARVYDKHPHPDGGYVCSQEEGGCGGRLYIPIEEIGVKAGFAIQPYKERQDPDMYSYFGRCVHQVKYDDALSDNAKESLIAEMVARMHECCAVERLLGTHFAERALVIPAPSSVRRNVQLVHSIAKGLANSKLEYANPLRKHTKVESKNRQHGAELADGEITCASKIDGRTILLVDDTYGEGATLRACVRALKQSGAGEIYFLSLCRNIYGGMKGRR